MKTRVIVGIILSLIFFLTLALGGYVTFVLFTALVVLSAYEMSTAMKKKGFSPFMGGVYACAALMYTANALYGSAGLALLIILCVMLTLCERLWNEKRTMGDIFSSLFMTIYPLMFYAILAYVVAYPDRTIGRTAMLLCFAAPLVGDTAAYFVGSAFGRHKLCPQISPNKTIEGSIAGLLGGVLGGVLTWALSPLWSYRAEFLPLVVLGLIGSAIGQMGDLFASSVKRWAEIKDYGTIFPEHGGSLDRLDSVLFCAPIAMLYLLIFGSL